MNKMTKNYSMKTRTILFAAFAAAAAVSCAKVAENTEISGVVVPAGISEVNVAVGQIDTLVPVTDGKFTLTVPTDVTVLGTVSAANYGANFIADGTPLNVVIDDETKVTSKYPKISVQERLNEFTVHGKSVGEEFMAKRQEIYSDTLMTDAQKEEAFDKFYEEFMQSYIDYNAGLVSDNKDNFIALLAIQNMRGEADDERLNSLIDGLSPEIGGHRYVQGMKKAITARLETAEGKMFKDFTVNTVYGQTRSIPPQPLYKEVNFSDYVGKGKYVLVDFWSPWCGPCKREIPNIKAVYEKYKGEKFDVLSIAVWEREPVEVTISTAAELGVNWNQINNAGSVPTEIYGIEGIPHIMLIGPDGTILKRGLYGANVEEAVAECLAE